MSGRLSGAALLPLLLLASIDGITRVDGGIVRGPTENRQIALVFTGHEHAESAPTILDALSKRRAQASFFLTGTFLRNRAHGAIVRRIIGEGHYLGPHSDAHLLYCPWAGPKVTLVSRETFTADLERNIDAIQDYGVPRGAIRFFLPPYEWYNEEIVRWTEARGLTLVNYTPGTRSTADYTEEGTKPFVASDAIFDSILTREREDPHGLNGFLLLLHAGAGPKRTDKFHRRFDELVATLVARGYSLVRIDALLAAVR